MCSARVSLAISAEIQPPSVTPARICWALYPCAIWRTFVAAMIWS